MSDFGIYAGGIGSGAASGAATGSAAGPWGTAIGGVIGAGMGALGAFGKSKAERQRRRAEAERRAARERAMQRLAEWRTRYKNTNETSPEVKAEADRMYRQLQPGIQSAENQASSGIADASSGYGVGSPAQGAMAQNAMFQAAQARANAQLGTMDAALGNARQAMLNELGVLSSENALDYGHYNQDFANARADLGNENDSYYGFLNEALNVLSKYASMKGSQRGQGGGFVWGDDSYEIDR